VKEQQWTWNQQKSESQKLQNVLSEYPPADEFNADYTGLLY
jgi:hypothetical protein